MIKKCLSTSLRKGVEYLVERQQKSSERVAKEFVVYKFQVYDRVVIDKEELAFLCTKMDYME